MPRRCSPPHATCPEPMEAFRLRFGRGRRRSGTAPGRGRFRRMLGNRLLWPGMIGVALAVGLGVQIGESAIGAIDPIHFQGAAPPVRAVDPGALQPPAQPVYAQGYGWEQGEAARRADSAGAEDFDYVPQPVPQPAAAPAWQSEQAPIRLAPWPPGQVSAHPDIERYADFPIEQKPVTQPTPAPPQAPEAAPLQQPEKTPPADE